MVFRFFAYYQCCISRARSAARRLYVVRWCVIRGRSFFLTEDTGAVLWDPVPRAALVGCLGTNPGAADVIALRLMLRGVLSNCALGIAAFALGPHLRRSSFSAYSGWEGPRVPAPLRPSRLPPAILPVRGARLGSSRHALVSCRSAHALGRAQSG